MEEMGVNKCSSSRSSLWFTLKTHGSADHPHASTFMRCSALMSIYGWIWACRGRDMRLNQLHIFTGWFGIQKRKYLTGTRNMQAFRNPSIICRSCISSSDTLFHKWDLRTVAGQRVREMRFTWTMSLSAKRPLEDTLTSSPSSSSIAADYKHII